MDLGLKAHVNYNTLRLSRAWHLREAGEAPEKIQRLLARRVARDGASFRHLTC